MNISEHAAVLKDRVRPSDLIVLAWRGIWEAPRAGTLKDILRQAHCPIMVVRT